MKIRLVGLPDEVPAALDKIRSTFDVISESAPYPMRQSREVRVYVEIRLLGGAR